jgi:hypothetical protein
MNFTSIDFETANNTKVGICAAGSAAKQNVDDYYERNMTCRVGSFP